VSAVASDTCDQNPTVTCSYASDEPDAGCGSGDQAGDIQLVAGTLELRAERCGTDATSTSGRVYTITCVATDASGNISAPAQAFVGVPHDRDCHFRDDGTFVCH
jgi:hypothetical protein